MRSLLVRTVVGTVCLCPDEACAREALDAATVPLDDASQSQADACLASLATPVVRKAAIAVKAWKAAACACTDATCADQAVADHRRRLAKALVYDPDSVGTAPARQRIVDEGIACLEKIGYRGTVSKAITARVEAMRGYCKCRRQNCRPPGDKDGEALVPMTPAERDVFQRARCHNDKAHGP